MNPAIERGFAFLALQFLERYVPENEEGPRTQWHGYPDAGSALRANGLMSGALLVVFVLCVSYADQHVDGRIDSKLNAYAKADEVDGKVSELKASITTLQTSVVVGFIRSDISNTKQQIASLDRQIAERELLINNSTGPTRELHVAQLNTLQRAKDTATRELDSLERQARQPQPPPR